MNNSNKKHLENSNYTDGFPTEDSPKNKVPSESRDPSRPFDSGVKKENKNGFDTAKNPTGTTLNEKDKYKK